MRRLPLMLAAAVVLAVGLAVVATVKTGPKNDGGKPAAVAASDQAGGKDAPSGNGGTGGSGTRTPDQMRAAIPLPKPKITDEEYQNLIGSKQKPQ